MNKFAFGNKLKLFRTGWCSVHEVSQNDGQNICIFKNNAFITKETHDVLVKTRGDL